MDPLGGCEGVPNTQKCWWMFYTPSYACFFFFGGGTKSCFIRFSKTSKYLALLVQKQRLKFENILDDLVKDLRPTMGKWLSKSWAAHVIKYHKAIKDNAKAVVIIKTILLHVKERSMASFTHYLELNICNMPDIVLSSFTEYCSFNGEVTKLLNDIILNSSMFCFSIFFKPMCQ